MHIRSIAATAAAVGVLFTVGLGTSSAAQAATSPGGTNCRGWADVAGGVYLSPCTNASVDGNTGWDDIGASSWVYNPNHLDIDVCFQALLVNANGSTTQKYDYGCEGWTSTTTSNGTYMTPTLGWVDPPAGTYVIASGFWATINGVYGYYGDVQSPQIYTNGQNNF